MDGKPGNNGASTLARRRFDCQPGIASRVYSGIIEAPPCRYCDAPGQGDLAICAPCEADLPLNDHACPNCAIPLEETATICGQCLRRAPPWIAAAATVRYDFPADWLVRRLKFANDIAMVRLISGLMVRRPPEFLLDADCLVPVPMHWRRRLSRGYDQAAELARMLARRTRLPARPLLRRTRGTSPQVGMSATARRRNLAGAIAWNLPVIDRLVRGRPSTVCLVDDVLTTGATAQACARALLAAGVSRVYLWCFARA